MSENQQDKPVPEVDESAADAEFPDIEPAMHVEAPKKKRSIPFTALLALMVALLAFAGVAYQLLVGVETPEPFVQDHSASDANAAATAANSEAIADLRQRVAALAGEAAVSPRELDDLERRLRRDREALESLPGRMSNVETSVASIQGISAGVRDTWLLEEAEYYMQIANAQLQLAGNPQLARLALLQADERIQQLANPALTNVRRVLANELRALESMDVPDIEGVTLTLASLNDAVESLPLRKDVEQPVQEQAADNAELGGFDRAVASLKDTMSGVVSVRRTDETVRPLIAPESAYFLRANLALQLQSARLALLRGEKAVFRQSLDDANDWLGEYYDADAPSVRNTRDTIISLRDKLFDIENPDISESLRLLRQFRTLAGNGDSTNSAPSSSTESDAASGEDQPDL